MTIDTRDLKRLTNEELRETMRRCQNDIDSGAESPDTYETFVLAQHELVRRTWT